ncbi:two-component system activity regulator YycH, partial [Staphylococcus epidermidis]
YTEIITNKDTIDKATHVFAPSKPKDLKTYRMVFNTISVERMNSILFDDSTIVRSSQSGTTTYNNNTGVANYNDKDEMYHYKNLSEDAKSSSNMQETIPGTYEFINSHGGFLNEDYRLFKTDNRTGKLTYQRFLNGHPTFNKQNFNEIQVTWGDKGVYDYQRSLLKTDVTLNSEESKSVPTVESVRSALANHPDIDFEKVTNIAIGYDMDDKANNEDIEVQRNCELIPRWFVEYDGNWYAYKDGRLE